MKKQQAGFSAVELVIVLTVVGVIGAVGFMVMGRSDSSEDTPTTKKTQSAVAKPTEESGMCFGVSKATIKSILGSPADNLQDLSDTGEQTVGQGDKAQTCVYTFAAGATAENSFMIDRGTYANQANLADSQKYITDTGAAVTGLGDSATYSATDVALTNTRDFVLTVRQDLKIYKFEISQPKASLGYTDASAQTALVKIAQAATL